MQESTHDILSHGDRIHDVSACAGRGRVCKWKHDRVSKTEMWYCAIDQLIDCRAYVVGSWQPAGQSASVLLMRCALSRSVRCASSRTLLPWRLRFTSSKRCSRLVGFVHRSLAWGDLCFAHFISDCYCFRLFLCFYRNTIQIRFTFIRRPFVDLVTSTSDIMQVNDKYGFCLPVF